MEDYEKKYKEALELARDYYKANLKLNNADENLLLEDIFPELKESEDERIKKELIDYFINDDKYSVIKSPKYKELVALFEKQKDIDSKEYVFRPLAGCDINTAAIQAVEQQKLGNKIVLAFNGAYISVEEKTANEIVKEYYSWIEKQGEQKPVVVDFKAKDWYVSKVDGKIHDMTYNPTDKVEPKFKVGDWLTIKE